VSQDAARSMPSVDSLDVQVFVSEAIVVFTACSHPGVINVLRDARNVFGEVPLHAVIEICKDFSVPRLRVDAIVRPRFGWLHQACRRRRP
jgi:metal-dependent hydrolase (beta-lactamase superfamily II)